METKKLEYNWLRECDPRYTEHTCIFKDVPCLMKFCPAWYSSGDRGGRCLMVPGFREDE